MQPDQATQGAAEKLNEWLFAELRECGYEGDALYDMALKVLQRVREMKKAEKA